MVSLNTEKVHTLQERQKAFGLVLIMFSNETSIDGNTPTISSAQIQFTETTGSVELPAGLLCPGHSSCRHQQTRPLRATDAGITNISTLNGPIPEFKPLRSCYRHVILELRRWYIYFFSQTQMVIRKNPISAFNPLVASSGFEIVSNRDETQTESSKNGTVPPDGKDDRRTRRQTDKSKDGQVERRTRRQTDKSTDGQDDRRTSRHMDKTTYRQDDRRTRRQADKTTGGQVDRRTRRQTDKTTDGQDDRWTRRQVNKPTGGQDDRRTRRQTDKTTDGQDDRRTRRQADKTTGGQDDRRTRRQTDKPTYRQVDRRTSRHTDKTTDGQDDRRSRRQTDKTTHS
ncbi:hypothetical protein J6590_095374 [Homalodisca vitripennis]|nr:hypothetical protein J6590_095374 [Homalodisca vitripennis]